MDNNKDKPITKIEQAQKVIKSWRTLEEQRIIDNLQLQGRTPNAEDFYGLSSQIRLMRELPFDTLAEVMHHAVRQDHRVSMEYIKTFREKYHWCFITHQRREIDKDEKDVIHLSELKEIICDWIDGAVHKEFLQRKCFKLDLFDFLQKIKLDLPVEYKNKLSHLDDVQLENNLISIDNNERKKTKQIKKFRDFIKDQNQTEEVLAKLHKWIGNKTNSDALKIITKAMWIELIDIKPTARSIKEEFPTITCTDQQISKILNENKPTLKKMITDIYKEYEQV